MKLPLRTVPFAAVTLLVASAAVQGCSTTNITVVQGEGGSDAGVTFSADDAGEDDAATDGGPDDATTSGAKNPYGASYPTAHIGWRVRSGSTPGQVIANLKLSGYAAGAGGTVKNGSLADLFDPEGRTHDMVAAILDARWDAYADMMQTSLAAGLPARVALFVVVGEGTTASAPATAADLTAWHTKYPAVASYLDPSWSQWMPLNDYVAVPNVVELDARTMEIVSATLGKLSSPKSDLETAAAAIKARPPSY